MATVNEQITLVADADLVTYPDVVAKLILSVSPNYLLTPSATLQSFIDLASTAQDAYTSGLLFFDTASVAGSASLSYKLKELVRIVIIASTFINLSASYTDYLNLAGLCSSAFKVVSSDTVGFSADAVIDTILSLATLVSEEVTATFAFSPSSHVTATVAYDISPVFTLRDTAELTSALLFLVDAGVLFVVPRTLALTTAWYVFPKAISMHTLSPESVCEWNDIVYMAFDDGIYIFDDVTLVSDTGLVFDFGNFSSPVFKRLGDMFIAGSFDSLTVAVDMDGVRNTYISSVNKIKFAKGHKGYSIKLFIEGLTELDAVDLLLIALTKRRRYS